VISLPDENHIAERKRGTHYFFLLLFSVTPRLCGEAFDFGFFQKKTARKTSGPF